MKRIILPVLIAAVLVACGEQKPAKDSLLGAFEKRELQYKDANDLGQITVAVDSMLIALADFEVVFPEDSLIAEMYFKVGMALQRAGKGKDAIKIYEKAANEKFDDFKGAKGDQALYQIAYIYQEDLVDTRSARAYYRDLIKRYPNTLWANFAKEGLETLAKMNRGEIER
jgi:tetratricopeptide (TPR) repeat protein